MEFRRRIAKCLPYILFIRPLPPKHQSTGSPKNSAAQLRASPISVNKTHFQDFKMKKMVLKVTIEDQKSKRKALKVVAAVEGVDSVAVDMKEKKITVIGVADPVNVTAKLRKSGFGFAELLSVGPAKEEKKEEKKDEKKDEKKVQTPKVVFIETPYDYGFESQENPNACGCTIC